jgi:hypothetical protein
VLLASLDRSHCDLQATAKAVPKKHLTGLAKLKHDESYMTTGKDFLKLHGSKAKKQDKKVRACPGRPCVLGDLGRSQSGARLVNSSPACPCR